MVKEYKEEDDDEYKEGMYLTEEEQVYLFPDEQPLIGGVCPLVNSFLNEPTTARFDQVKRQTQIN